MKLPQLQRRILKMFLVFNFFKNRNNFSGDKFVIYIITPIIIIIVIISLIKNNDQIEGINKNKKTTVGFITKIRHGGNNAGTSNIIYKYNVNSKKFKTSDALYDGYPKRVRLSKPIIGKYYPVEYDSLHPEESRILITEKSLNPHELILFGNTITGSISKILYFKGNQYADFYINYKYRNEKFSFRTRLHKDSLSCGEISDCRKNKTIKLKISKKYPIFNNLYFKSRDRQTKSAYTNYN